MGKISKILAALALVIISQTMAGALDGRALAAGGDYVWWYMDGLPWRDRDGGMRVLYRLNLPPGAQVTAEPEVYYTATQWRHRDEDRRQTPERRHYLKRVERQGPGYVMEVYSGSSQRFLVRARVEIDGRPYYAQTLFSLGGSSDRPDSGREEVESIPAWPELALADPRLSRARLEEELTLLVRPPELAPAMVSVFDQTGGILARPPVSEAAFSFTPPYDRKLASGGYRGHNHIIFVARLPLDQGVVTCYLPVHRSQKSHSSIAAGIGAASVTAAIGLVFVWMARRRFKFR